MSSVSDLIEVELVFVRGGSSLYELFAEVLTPMAVYQYYVHIGPTGLSTVYLCVGFV